MIQPPETNIDLRERSPLTLAFVGDGVLELYVRARLVAASRIGPAALHREAVELVSARAQHILLTQIEPLLTEVERDIVRRGRNASKATVSKNATVQEYRSSTGLEALFGWLYLRGEMERLDALFDLVWEAYRADKE